MNGLNPETVSEFTRLELAGWGGGWGPWAAAALLAALAVQALVAYRRETILSRRARRLLAGLRLAALALLFAILAEPSLVSYRERVRETATAVLLDASLSMGARDAYPEAALPGVAGATGLDPALLAGAEPPTRAELVAALLAGESGEFLERLRRRNRLALYAFGENLSPLGAGVFPRVGEAGDPGAEAPLAAAALAPRDRATRLGGALGELLRRNGSGRLAAVIILTDGRENGLAPVAAAAAAAGRRGVPCYPVGVGDPSPARNLQVERVDAPETVLADHPFVLTARLVNRGLAGRRVAVTVERRPAGAPAGEVVGRRELTLGEGASEAAFRLKAPVPGRFRFRVAATVPREDIWPEDNEDVADVEAVERRLRLLLVAGAPSWEYRFLAGLLGREEGVELETLLQGAAPGPGRWAGFPAAGGDALFSFDVVLLLDPDLEALREGWDEQLRRFVDEHRGGLLYQAGRRFSGRLLGDGRFRSLAELLPVRPADDAWRPARGAGREARALVLTPAGREHPAARELGDRFPGVYWHYPAPEEKPGAAVLARLEAPGGPPFIASQFYGQGRVVFIGGDELWRLRGVSEEGYRVFWRQLVFSLLEGRIRGGRARVVLRADRERCRVGEAVQLHARLFRLPEGDFLPLTLARPPAARLLLPGGGEESVALVAGEEPGSYRGEFFPDRPGAYEAVLAHPEARAMESRLTIRARLPDLETGDTRLDEPLLRELAAASGGRYFSLAQARGLPELIPARRRRQRQAGEVLPLWDSGWLLGLAAGLLFAEWIGRKYWRLA